MLETIREYARERLEADPSLGVVHRRHLAYFCELAETAEPHLTAADQGVWLDRLERELDNIREALGRAFHMREAAEGLRLASALWRFWFQRGYLREGRSWLEALLASESDVDPRIRAKAYTALGALTYWLVDVDATAHAYETAVRLTTRSAIARRRRRRSTTLATCRRSATTCPGRVRRSSELSRRRWRWDGQTSSRARNTHWAS